MRLKYTLVIFGAALLFLNGLAVANPDEEVEVEDDDAVEVDDEEPLSVHRERPMYGRPLPSGPTFLTEPFDTRAEFLKRWVLSQAKKDGAESQIAKYDGKWEVEEGEDNPINGDLGLVLKSKAKHHAIATKLDKVFEFKGKPFIAQYEVRFQNGIDCGGAYIKLLSKADSLSLKTFTDKTPYTIMFGPDKCGNDHKLHFIFRHRNPKTGVYEEKHAQKPTAKLENFFSDKRTHVYTLIVNPDNTYEIRVDNGLVASGDLLSTVHPPVNPPEEIDDPNDKKPSDWDNRERIPDPDATKPEDWDESEPATIEDESAEMPSGWLEDKEVYIPDPSAVKPDDWDDEMDGEWEAPLIDNPECKDAPGCGKWTRPSAPNPKYKGVWKPPMIDNPDYKGEWKPRRIANPDYFEDKEPYKMTPIEAVGLELWSMTDGIVFDNFIIADNLSTVEDFTSITWEVKSMEERTASSTGQSIIQAIKDATNERPWLWAVFILVVVLPIILIITYCCSGSGPKSDAQPDEIEAHRKKFDDPSPDVVEEEPEEEEKAEEEKSEDEAEETEEDKGAKGDAAQVDAGKKEQGKKEEKESGAAESGAAGDGAAEQGEDEAGSEGQVGGSPKSNSPRKRRARKE